MNEKKKIKKTLVIAEAGVNHKNDIDIAFKLVETAKKANADVIKFQTFNASKLTLKENNTALYQTKNTGLENQYDLLKKLELSHEMHYKIIDYCNKLKIEFLSTAFDEDSLKFLIKNGIKRIKIPSGEITNLPFLINVASFNIPVILSTGMSNLDEIEKAYDILIDNGLKKNKISILHCTSDYPTLTNDLNLNCIKTLQKIFGNNVGFSDHSIGYEAAIAAVAIGANIIEKHITLDRSFEGPDHIASMEPKDFFKYVKFIRQTENALGSFEKKPTKNELMTMKLVRKSIVAKKDIHIGELFSEDNLTTKRPGTGISPMFWTKLLGKQSSQSYKTDELIKESIS